MITSLLFSTVVFFSQPASTSRQFTVGHYKFEIETYAADPRDCCSLPAGGPPKFVRIKSTYKGEVMCVPRSALATLANVKSIRYKSGTDNLKLIFVGGETSTLYTSVLTIRNGYVMHVLVTDGEFPKAVRTEITYTNSILPES